MAENFEINVTTSKGTPIIIKESSPLEINLQSAPKENVNLSKNEMKLEILSSVAGAKGDSMYQIAVRHGYTGTEEEFINEFMAGGSGNGFYNVDNEHPISGGNYTLESAVEVVSTDLAIKDETKNGMIITFWDGGEWKTYRYKLFYDHANPSAFADVSNWEEFKGSGGGGSESGRIILRRESDNVMTKVGSPVHIKFYYDHVTGTGEEQESTGNAGVAKIIISRGGYQQILNRTLSAGSHSDVDITRYMGIGVTSVRLQVEVDTGLTKQSAALAWTISEVSLNLMSDSLTGYTVVEQGTDLEIAYTLESGSSDTKAVILYLDGEQYDQSTIATSVGSGTFTIGTSDLAYGQHTIQIRAQQATGEIDEHEQSILLYSNLIYAVIGVYTQAGTTPLLTMKVNIPDGSAIFGLLDPLVLNLNQYDTLTFSYGARSYDNISTEVVIKDGNDTIATATNKRTSEDFSVRVLASGSHSYTINAGENVQIAIGVAATDVDLGVEVPSGRTMFLDSIQHGHNNTDANKDTWTNTENGVTTATTMSGFSWSGDGWINGALHLKGDARAVVDYQPLHSTSSGGMVCGFRYKCTDVEEGSEDEKIISCLDTNNTGFYITPNEVVMIQNGMVRTTMKTAEGNVYDVAFVVWQPSGSSSDARKNARFIYIYIDGIISGGFRLAEGSTLFQPTSVPISLGASGVTTDIYRMWAYNRALNDSEMLDTFILDQDDNIDYLLEKRDDNDILDTTGNVTPDSLPDGIRVMIITGQAVEPSSGETMASVLAAAKYNDKSTYFPCMEISSYIKGASDRSKNFIARNTGTGQETGKNIPLRLRLQGTSSLAYPVKNYRIYTNKSLMYVGNNPEMPFGETGEIANKGLFAMHDASAPVNVWCLKADYAESSSTHNTGMARMVNDTLKAINILTPAQRDVDDSEYPYDVRTTVDGEPCLLFYRETLTDTPIFLGKFNFNNDKSTEAVFGFTGITGYHDVAPLDDIDNQETEFVAQQYKNATGEDLGVDLTECWEYKNNENPMGSFLDDDFMSDREFTKTNPDGTKTSHIARAWTGTFEARYPDEDDLNGAFEDGTIDPYYLHNLVSWVKSTHVLDTDTEQQAATKLQKFHDELSQYFDVEHLCSYFAFTQIMACLDQMVKNMMMGFWYDKNATTSTTMGKVRAYMIFYDNDTILGLINNGRLLAPFDVQRDTVQMYDAGGNPVYFYAGHESVLWNNLVSQFSTEIRNAYVKIRGFLTNQKIFEYFDRDQASMFCERIYNLDALNKYVAPIGMTETAVAPYRDLMQGSRKSHRRYFVEKRLSLFDNAWRAGEYYSSANEISFKGISAGGSAITLTIRKNGNVEVQSDVSDDFVKNYVVAGNTPTTIGKLTPSAVGTIFHVYGMRQLTSLNLAEWDFDQLNLGSFQYLEEFVFGSKLKVDGVTENPFTKPYYNSGLILGDSMPRLKRFIAQNLTALPSADLSGCQMIEEIDLTGSKAISSVNIPVGAPLTKYKLPTAGIKPDWRNSGGYIESSGTQYIDSGVSSFGFRIVCKLNVIGSDLRTIVGSYDTNKCNFVRIDQDNKICVAIGSVDTIIVEDFQQNTDCVIDISNISGSIFYKLNGNTIKSSQNIYSDTSYYNGNIFIGANNISNNSAEHFFKGKIYYLKIYNKIGTLVREMYPAVDGNGVACMYDYVTESFFYNQGTGEFTVSQEVIDTAAVPDFTLYRLSLVGLPNLKIQDWRNSGGYIESSGTQYIDTRIVLNNLINKYVIEFDFIPTNVYVSDSKILSAGDMLYIVYSGKFQVNKGNRAIVVTNQLLNNQRYYGIINSDESYISLNNERVTVSTLQNYRTDNNLILFAYNYNSNIQDFFYGKLFSLKIYTNGTLVREMYPAIDDNGVACMYDYVTESFFYNQGTGEFTVSQEVIDAKVDSDLGVPSKIQSLTFRDCPLINGFDLLKTIASAYNTALSTVNVTLPSAISGPIADLITIANLWNSNTGEASNLKVYGSYTVTDASLTTAQCEAIGYDPNGAATQMSSKIYGLMVTIDQSTILSKTSNMALQTFDPTFTANYNPAVSIIFEQAGFGSYIDSNNKTNGWYMTSQQAAAFDKFYNVGNISRLFGSKTTLTDVNGICGTINATYDFTNFNQINSFYNVTEFSENEFFNCTKLTTVIIPTFLTSIHIDSFAGCNHIETLYYNAIKCVQKFSGDRGFMQAASQTLENVIIGSLVESLVGGFIYMNDFSFSKVKGNIVIPSGVTFIRLSSFRQVSPGPLSITIEGNVTEIEDAAFYKSTGITYIHLLTETPPILETSNVFYQTSCIFYVGNGSSTTHDDAIVNAYKNASGWSDYSSRIQSWYSHEHPSA